MRLKYPVLMIHGCGFRDKVLGINYWGRIPKQMEKNGVKVYYGGTDAWGAIESNAQKVKEKIENIVKKQGVEKFNVIAHSRGGLEARYLISSLKLSSVIASLTTISTPHRGVKAMNIALNINNGVYKFVSFFINLWFKILGDKNPDFFKSSRQLSEQECTEFNKINIDDKLVYYQSYAAKMKHFFSDFLFLFLNPFLKITDGENDGLCPVESAKWGSFKGVITTEGKFGISHSGIVDAYRVKYKGIDIPKLYLSILEDLERNGY
ncbi:MAG: alpha/beta hydrolase [Spirochaetes bacterium]|nr:alpha/beta hydrolase [Spirochaetota bacterium]